MYEIVYMINATGVRITKPFYSLREALALKNKLKYSKRCKFIAFHDYSD